MANINTLAAYTHIQKVIILCHETWRKNCSYLKAIYILNMEECLQKQNIRNMLFYLPMFICEFSSEHCL